MLTLTIRCECGLCSTYVELLEAGPDHVMMSDFQGRLEAQGAVWAEPKKDHRILLCPRCDTRVRLRDEQPL